ncbi:hypothetical protein SMACR_07973 [Sordaria macrospora]|uniref:WGS project CABT00000000 data, contig 2.48 n=2 Tax=Sordaria macrospora TaxID=5147 RepID=F7W922_SORMK|nr:uncharacterized protein SMAC_07973 [Sordaria macrospora k-hell]KAA8631946.1 hypothetical protein SMACR_07973 [Sordaria macrospora]KAH7632344.1 hypothetical protein B0T09DRAFT_72762 [Sordaria sp. MPI-SDFR-AT-0083]WPJ61153.1 hypothetical protein SMAC4_07973 [Sordaria macrospora]CCC13903.1 unnamed protein product [Sordaria macrospora k-hell]
MLASRAGASILRSTVRQPISNQVAFTRSVGQRGYASLGNAHKASDRTWLLTSLGISVPIGLYLVSSGSAKKKPIGHGKEHEGYKSHEEYAWEQPTEKDVAKAKLKETSSDNNNLNFKTPDEGNSKQSNQRDRLKDDKSAGKLGVVSEGSSTYEASPKTVVPPPSAESSHPSGKESSTSSESDLPDSRPGASLTEKAINRE